jgi:hypothetical protein
MFGLYPYSGSRQGLEVGSCFVGVHSEVSKSTAHKQQNIPMSQLHPIPMFETNYPNNQLSDSITHRMDPLMSSPPLDTILSQFYPPHIHKIHLNTVFHLLFQTSVSTSFTGIYQPKFCMHSLLLPSHAQHYRTRGRRDVPVSRGQNHLSLRYGNYTGITQSAWHLVYGVDERGIAIT